VPSQYAQIIRTAKKRGDPYNVNEVSYSDFFKIQDLAPVYRKRIKYLIRIKF
jgi:hypothetical protein